MCVCLYTVYGNEISIYNRSSCIHTVFRCPLVSVALSACLSLPLYHHHYLSHSHTHNQPEALTHLFMHLSCTLVYLSASLCFMQTQTPCERTHRLTQGFWKSARMVDPLVVVGIEVCWHVKDGEGDVLIQPKGLYKTLQTVL